MNEERINFLKRVTKYFEIVKGGKEDYQCLFPSSHFPSPLRGEDKGEGEVIKRAGTFASAISSLLIEKTGGVKKERFPSFSHAEIRRKRVGCFVRS